MGVLRLDSWKVFLIMMSTIIGASIVDDKYVLIKTTISIIAYAAIFGWYLIVGSTINDSLPDEDYKSDTLFKINCVYLFAFLAMSKVMQNASEVVESEMPIYIMIAFGYYAFAFLYVVFFSASSFIKAEENQIGRKDKLKLESVYLSFLLFIIGVWVLHPRFQQLYPKHQ